MFVKKLFVAAAAVAGLAIERPTEFEYGPVVLDQPVFHANDTDNSNLIRRGVGQGKAGELMGSSTIYEHWIDCPGHQEWPHANYTVSPPEIPLVIPFNKPTDRYGIPIGWPLNIFGAEIKGGPKKDLSLEPIYCCRPTWWCFVLAYESKQKYDPWWSMKDHDRESWSKLQCCIAEYTKTCERPQPGDHYHWNPPPLCSNWHDRHPDNEKWLP